MTSPNESVPVLETRGLKAGYKKIEVVHGVDLTLHRGEVVALFGPNGAGKTTTLRAVMGILPPMEGTILWNGRATSIPPHKRARAGVAFVTERSVFQQLSTLGNLRLGRGDPERALELFPELRRLLKRRAGLLSGGEQQMLTMARALSSDPSVLLLDEVSAGLAPVIVNRLFEAAREAADRGVAILLVEQQIRRALSVADRVYVLSQGEVTLTGSKDEVSAQIERLEDSYFARKPAEAALAPPII